MENAGDWAESLPTLSKAISKRMVPTYNGFASWVRVLSEEEEKKLSGIRVDYVVGILFHSATDPALEFIQDSSKKDPSLWNLYKKIIQFPPLQNYPDTELWAERILSFLHRCGYGEELLSNAVFSEILAFSDDTQRDMLVQAFIEAADSMGVDELLKQLLSYKNKYL